MIQVDVPGLTLVNRFSESEPYLSDLEGWYDSGERNRSLDQRPGGVGSFGDDAPEEPSRIYTISGQMVVLGGDWYAVRRRIVMLQNLDDFTLTVRDGSGTLHATVSVQGRVTFDLIDERGIATFEFALLAIDPRKYGTLVPHETELPVAGTGVVDPITSPVMDGEPGTPGRVVLYNSGTAPSTPDIVVTGELSSGFEIVAIEKGRRIRVERFIPEGSFVRVDQDRGQVWMDDQSAISGNLTRREWWTVEPGETVTVQFISLGASRGTPKLTAMFAPAER